MKKRSVGPLISVIAIVISVIALWTSCNSNSIAEKALKQSTEQFLATNKPQIVIRPHMEEPNDFNLSLDGSELHFKFVFTLKNVGNVTACNIRLPHTEKSDPCGPDISVLVLDEPSVILAPGETYYLCFEGTSNYKSPEKAKEFFEKELTPTGKGIKVEIPIIYSSEICPDKFYGSFLSVRVAKDGARYVKMDYSEISDQMHEFEQIKEEARKSGIKYLVISEKGKASE